MPEELLNSDQAAIYGYTCRVNDMRRRLVLFTTDPSASNQSVDGTAKLNGRQLRLQGDRDITRSNSMRLRDGEITVIVEVDGELVAKGDAGDQADGRGTLTIFSDQSKTMPVLISCIEM